MNKVRKALQGKKTYILSLLTAVWAVYGYMAGNLTFEQMVQVLQVSGIGATIRAAM